MGKSTTLDVIEAEYDDLKKQILSERIHMFHAAAGRVIQLIAIGSVRFDLIGESSARGLGAVSKITNIHRQPPMGRNSRRLMLQLEECDTCRRLSEICPGRRDN